MVSICSQPGIACLRTVVFSVLAIALSAVPIRAQKGNPSTGGSGGSRGSASGEASGRFGVPPLQPWARRNMEPKVFIPIVEPLPIPVMVEDESCLPWDVTDVRGASVSTTRLGVPAKARSQYEKACGAFKKKKLPEAEQHVRDAIRQYPKYPAAWVMLGQVLQDEQKMNEARDACLQPISADPTYLPPYLCLAGLLDLEKKWGDLLTWSDRFLGISLAGDMYAHYYNGLALFHFRKFQEAQKSVSEAIAIDSDHHQPGLNFLLAQIYGEQRDVFDATVQIRQFVKYSNSRQDKDAAREYLSELQSQLNAK
jgi:tetratricopeptide (TPR) repeat protein